MMIEISMIRDLVAIFGVIAGFSYYVLTVRVNQKNQEIMIKNQEQTLKTRNTTLFQQTLGTFTTNDWGIRYTQILDINPVSSYEEFIELTNSNPQYAEAWRWIFVSLDLWGIYLKEGVLDINMFAKFNPWWMKRFWKRYKPIVYEQRKNTAPDYFVHMEYYMDSIEKYVEEHPEILNPNR